MEYNNYLLVFLFGMITRILAEDLNIFYYILVFIFCYVSGFYFINFLEKNFLNSLIVIKKNDGSEKNGKKYRVGK